MHNESSLLTMLSHTTSTMHLCFSLSNSDYDWLSMPLRIRLKKETRLLVVSLPYQNLEMLDISRIQIYNLKSRTPCPHESLDLLKEPHLGTEFPEHHGPTLLSAPDSPLDLEIHVIPPVPSQCCSCSAVAAM